MPTPNPPHTPPRQHPTTAAGDDPPYDLEFRSTVDDGWYSGRIVLEDGGETLAVKLLDFPESNDERFSVRDFKTVDDVDEFVGRFRPISEQLQDGECGRVQEGMRVCASRTFAVGDIRYYDAIVEAVHHEKHLFGKEEECKCEFVLCWQHGPYEGIITNANIAHVCMIQPSAESDSRLASFSKMVKKKIEPSAISDLVSIGNAFSPLNGTTLLLTNNCSRSSENSTQVKLEDIQSPSPVGRRKVAGRISEHHKNNLQDIRRSFITEKDLSSSHMGKMSKKLSTFSQRGLQGKEEIGQFIGSSGGKGGIIKCYENNLQLVDSGGLLGPKIGLSLSSVVATSKKYSGSSQNGLQVMDEDRARRECLSPVGRNEGLACSEDPNSKSHHFIFVDNLEKDLSSSSIVKFIQNHTSISPQACIFPSLSTEIYARGVIVTDCEKKLKEICKFLQSPDHIITSSKGRPWFVHEEPSGCKTFETTIRGMMPIVQEETTVEELKVVPKEAQGYRQAKEMKDLFFEFVEHQKRLHNRLAWEEKMISRGTTEDDTRVLFFEFLEHQKGLHNRLASKEGMT